MSTIQPRKILKNHPDSSPDLAAIQPPGIVPLSEVKQYYVVDKTPGTFASFWRPGAQGRTCDLNEAGIWTAQELETAYFRRNPSLMFIPVDSITEEMRNVVVFNSDIKAVQL